MESRRYMEPIRAKWIKRTYRSELELYVGAAWSHGNRNDK